MQGLPAPLLLTRQQAQTKQHWVLIFPSIMPELEQEE